MQNLGVRQLAMQIADACLGDLRPGEVQRFKVTEPLQVFQTAISDLRITEVQLLKPV